MFKKFHWGHGITIFYVCFVGIVITALVASFGVDHTLVVDDYYAKDLAYQDTYNKMSNHLDSKGITIKNENNLLLVSFADTLSDISGSIHFYRAADQSKDFTMPINNQNMRISTSDLDKGKWSLKLDWNQAGVSYYKEEIVYF